MSAQSDSFLYTTALQDYWEYSSVPKLSLYQRATLLITPPTRKKKPEAECSRPGYTMEQGLGSRALLWLTGEGCDVPQGLLPCGTERKTKALSPSSTSFYGQEVKKGPHKPLEGPGDH